MTGKGPSGCDRLGKTHQGDTDRTRQQLPDQFDVRQGQRRQPLRDQADRRNALGIETKEPRGGDASSHRNQRGRRMRPEILHTDQHNERCTGHRQGHQ